LKLLLKILHVQLHNWDEKNKDFVNGKTINEITLNEIFYHKAYQ